MLSLMESGGVAFLISPVSYTHLDVYKRQVYRWAIPFGVLAVALSLTLPEIKLRTSVHPVADEIPLSNADPLS